MHYHAEKGVRYYKIPVIFFVLVSFEDLIK